MQKTSSCRTDLYQIWQFFPSHQRYEYLYFITESDSKRADTHKHTHKIRKQTLKTENNKRLIKIVVG